MTRPSRDINFQPGDCVRVRLSQGDENRHIRTPRYIQGRTGIVERIHGLYPNPESLAYGGSGAPSVPLYMVRFDQGMVWAEYPLGNQDRIFLDIFEHWLEPA